VNVSINGLNNKTIAHLVQHMISWQNFVVLKLKGNREFNIELGSEEDWPKKEISTKEEWVSLIDKLTSQNKEISNHLMNIDEEYLSAKAPAVEYSNHFMIDGIIHHNLYHLGQIGLMNSILNQSQ
tara:strand:+ start:85 stop:459 length:375 start_codon:yes stop_codon:yes gene_type:complete